MGWARGNEVLVARFGYHLKSGHRKVDAAIHRPGGGGFYSELVYWGHAIMIG